MAASDIPRLPTDIFGALAEVLAGCGLKKTLLELSLADHETRALALPALMRRVDITERNIRRAEKRFAEGMSGTDLVREIVVRGPTPRSLKKILSPCGNLSLLRFEAQFDVWGAAVVVDALMEACRAGTDWGALRV
ncbi:hypothetical protein DFJ74DRAFT_709005 [Hyaloraphidium curvatum]|nr:hypothetical protein DFJ74DRAFT_709005 [Hyaloraphidium curvatum]